MRDRLYPCNTMQNCWHMYVSACYIVLSNCQIVVRHIDSLWISYTLYLWLFTTHHELSTWVSFFLFVLNILIPYFKYTWPLCTHFARMLHCELYNLLGYFALKCAWSILLWIRSEWVYDHNELLHSGLEHHQLLHIAKIFVRVVEFSKVFFH